MHQLFVVSVVISMVTETEVAPEHVVAVKYSIMEAIRVIRVIPNGGMLYRGWVNRRKRHTSTAHTSPATPSLVLHPILVGPTPLVPASSPARVRLKLTVSLDSHRCVRRRKPASVAVAAVTVAGPLTTFRKLRRHRRVAARAQPSQVGVGTWLAGAGLATGHSPPRALSAGKGAAPSSSRSSIAATRASGGAELKVGWLGGRKSARQCTSRILHSTAVRLSQAGRALGQGPWALTHPRGGPSTCLLIGV
jgi:hypothetical protein